MKIALFGTNFSENFNKYIQHLVHKLESEKVEIYIEESFLEFVERDRKDILENKSTFKLRELVKMQCDRSYEIINSFL